MTDHLPYEAEEDDYLAEAHERYERVREDVDDAMDGADDVDRRNAPDEFAGIVGAWLVARQRSAGLRPRSTIPRSADDREWFDRHVHASYRAGRESARTAMRMRGIDPPSTPGISSSTTHQKALEQLYEDQRSHWRRLSNDLRSEVKDAVRTTQVDGATMVQTQRAIDERLVKTGKRRARYIAHTEPAKAFNWAMVSEYHDAGVENVEVDVSWETMGDSRVCEECMAQSGTYEVGVAEQMLRSGEFPAHPLCRCVLLPKS